MSAASIDRRRPVAARLLVLFASISVMAAYCAVVFAPEARASSTDCKDPVYLVTQLVAWFADCGDGEELTLSGSIDVTGIDFAVQSAATVTLNLNGEYLAVTSPDSHAGIAVPEGAKLVITDSAGGGKLVARGGRDSAGIGGSAGDSAGDISITGGATVSATCGIGTAGIGGAGIGGGARGAGGVITIHAGGDRPEAVVTAFAGSGAAIGSGAGPYSGEDRTTILIESSVIKATATGSGTAIGTAASGSPADITISAHSTGSGSIVDAATVGSGTVIGGTGSTIVVDGGSNVTARAGSQGAGIGGEGAQVTIGDSIISASSSQGAGIGGTHYSAAGSVRITGDASISVADSEGIGNGANTDEELPVDITSAGTLAAVGGLQLGAGATVQNSGAILIPSDATLTNKGSIAIDGTLHNHGEVVNDGVITIRHILHNSGLVTNNGVIEFDGGGLIDNSGTVWQGHDASFLGTPLGDNLWFPLTFDPNGGTSAGPNNAVVFATSLEDANTDLPTASRPHRAFVGWFHDRDGGSQLHTASTLADFGAAGEPITFYARWSAPPVDDDDAPADDTSSDNTPPSPPDDTSQPSDETPPPSGATRSFPDPTITSPSGCTAFGDMSDADLHCGNIGWLVAHQLTFGYPDRSFRAPAPVTRGAMTAFLYRMVHPGEPAPACTSQPFTDVPMHSQFPGTIQWAKNNGITYGYGDRSFGIHDATSRGAIASLLHRLAALTR